MHHAIGTQIGGAMKNVIAIACGVIIGSGLGHNASAAIITRGLSEIKELVSKNYKEITLLGQNVDSYLWYGVHNPFLVSERLFKMIISSVDFLELQ